MAECRRLFPNQQLVVLWLGSSIGNLSPAEAVQFFQDMTASAGTNIQVCVELQIAAEQGCRGARRSSNNCLRSGLDAALEDHQLLMPALCASAYVFCILIS